MSTPNLKRGEPGVGDGSTSPVSTASRAISEHPLARTRGLFARARVPLAPGFTLIEVLIAVVIIGLGMIGLSALFAGAARQQQIVSQSARSTTAARNAEAKILNLFSGFRDVTDLANCRHAGNPALVDPDDRLTFEWRPVFASDRDEDADALTVFNRPRSPNPALACTATYFERPVPEFVPLDISARFGSELSPSIDVDGFANFAQANLVPGLNPVFPVRSVVADTLEIDVYIAGTAAVGASDPDFPATPDGRLIRYTYAYDSSDPASPSAGEGPCNPDFIRLRPKGDLHPRFAAQGWSVADWKTQDFIGVQAFKCPVERSGDDPLLARIENMKIFGVLESPTGGTPANPSPRTGRYIQKIVVRSCTHRSLTLLTRAERVLSETSPDGTSRDVAAVSVMMRATPGNDNGALVCVFNYGVQGSTEGARFIPLERPGDPDHLRPVRAARLQLVYNNETQSYWFFAQRAPGDVTQDESFLARSGQTVLFAGDFSNGHAGADAAVRVVRVVTLDRSRGFWCELDRAPRAPRTGGAGAGTGLAIVGPTPLTIINAAFSPSSAAGAAGEHLAFGVNDLAGGRNPDGTADDAGTWRLTPIEATVFTVSR